MEGRDWYAVVGSGQPCPDCGFDAESVERIDLGPRILGEARRWDELLTELGDDDDAVRRRPDDGTWSAIEYAAHVAGVFTVFTERVQRLRAADPDDGDIELGWWDHEAAAEEEGYRARSVVDVRTAMADAAVTLALNLPRLDDPASWLRAGIRRGGERFTIEALTRFALHESIHHRADARRSAGAPAGG